MATSILKNYHELLYNIETCARQNGRNPNEITLIAVTKGISWENASPLYAAGCHHFGENKLQEALTKTPQAPYDISWHMIGSLQHNKVKKAVQTFSWIHSVDSFQLAKTISQCSLESSKTKTLTPINVFLQVNTSGETSKHGFTPEDCLQAYESIQAMPGIKVQGLMTIAPLTENESVIRSCFSKLRQLKEQMQLPHLSMGMTHDYRLAIAEGATFLRIGTAIFTPSYFSS